MAEAENYARELLARWGVPNSKVFGVSQSPLIGTKGSLGHSLERTSQSSVNLRPSSTGHLSEQALRGTCQSKGSSMGRPLSRGGLSVLELRRLALFQSPSDGLTKHQGSRLKQAAPRASGSMTAPHLQTTQRMPEMDEAHATPQRHTTTLGRVSTQHDESGPSQGGWRSKSAANLRTQEVEGDSLASSAKHRTGSSLEDSRPRRLAPMISTRADSERPSSSASCDDRFGLDQDASPGAGGPQEALQLLSTVTAHRQKVLKSPFVEYEDREKNQYWERKWLLENPEFIATRFRGLRRNGVQTRIHVKMAAQATMELMNSADADTELSELQRSKAKGKKSMQAASVSQQLPPPRRADKDLACVKSLKKLQRDMKDSTSTVPAAAGRADTDSEYLAALATALTPGAGRKDKEESVPTDSLSQHAVCNSVLQATWWMRSLLAEIRLSMV